MDILSIQGLLAMLQIIVIDILLAGDNAIVIGMAARNLPENLQKKAIFWGTAGAIILRLVMAFLFVEALNNIPALRLIGGILLLWIGYKLVADDSGEHNIEAKDNLRAAITTIVIADGIMGIDNVIGVVGAAGGNMMLVAIGMLITVPIIIYGSTLFVKVIERFPIILYVGGGILAWVGAAMSLEDGLIHDMVAPYALAIKIAAVILVVGASLLAKQLKK
ncbi:TerC family protein [Veillonella caviae]|uniref:TerC family protein n=2 Tax=Veillonella caviae TaxID=248316 RepID=UPI000F8C3F1B|nr:TerC family protein [Veillonella caviae]MCF0157461.1 TerC family protein [Veillonella sp.]MCI7693605.1 TerC family protein [Veillonella caviae]MDD7291556.1 TerC family protein [Veillonella caviae]MDY5253035.1 TerC family protein [Veillonella caviae]MDY5788226.1 TerC family protein [Veillonella caviae]